MRHDRSGTISARGARRARCGRCASRWVLLGAFQLVCAAAAAETRSSFRLTEVGRGPQDPRDANVAATDVVVRGVMDHPGGGGVAHMYLHRAIPERTQAAVRAGVALGTVTPDAGAGRFKVIVPQGSLQQAGLRPGERAFLACEFELPGGAQHFWGTAHLGPRDTSFAVPNSGLRRASARARKAEDGTPGAARAEPTHLASPWPAGAAIPLLGRRNASRPARAHRAPGASPSQRRRALSSRRSAATVRSEPTPAMIERTACTGCAVSRRPAHALAPEER